MKALNNQELQRRLDEHYEIYLRFKAAVEREKKTLDKDNQDDRSDMDIVLNEVGGKTDKSDDDIILKWYENKKVNGREDVTERENPNEEEARQSNAPKQERVQEIHQ